MVELADVVLALFFLLVSLWFGYRAATAATLYRSLSGIDSDGTTVIVDGEPAAIEGTVIVDEAATASERVVADTESPVALYVWRASFANVGRTVVDFKNRELKRSKSTFASGIESGTFRITTGSREVRVEPNWLAESHGGTKLSELTVGGVDRNRTFHTYLWDSPHVHLAGNSTEVPLGRLRGVVNEPDSNVSLDDYYLESRAVSDGDPLTVCGEVRITQGVPTIRGTDKTPLVISDRGFDGLSSTLRAKVVKYGFLSASLLALGAFLVR